MIPDTIDLTHLCRGCLTSKSSAANDASDLKPLFDDNHFNELFQSFTSIECSTVDGLPAFLCTTCIEQLNAFKSYKKLCILSHTKLKKWLLDERHQQNPKTLNDSNVNNNNNNQIQISYGRHRIDTIGNILKERNWQPRVLLSRYAPDKIASIVTSPNQSSIRQTESIQNVYEKSYRCKFCSQSFSSRRRITRHIHNHHKIDVKVEPSHKKRRKQFIMKINVKTISSILDAYNSLKCNLCTKQFTDENELRVHIIEHAIESSSSPTSSSNSSMVKQVAIRNVDQQKLFECPICTKFYSSKKYLNKHKRTIHQVKRMPLISDDTNANVNQNADAYVASSAQAQNLFQCSICFRSFASLNGRSAHYKVHQNS